MKPNTNVTIARLPVESSILNSIGHDPVSNTLEVEFSNGDVYRYGNFHADSFLEFQTAKSVGSHFMQRIKPRPDKFPYINMKDVESAGSVQDQRAVTTEQSDPTGAGDVQGSDINTPVIPGTLPDRGPQDGTEGDPDGDKTNRIEQTDSRTIAEKAADQKETNPKPPTEPQVI